MGTGGTITGKLYDSNGTTLLQSVSTTTTSTISGGIGFRAIGSNKMWDTVTESPFAGSASQRLAAGGADSAGSGTTGTGTTGTVASGGLQSIAAGLSSIGTPSSTVGSTFAAQTALTPQAAAPLHSAIGGDWLLSLEELVLDESMLHSLAQAKVQGH